MNTPELAALITDTLLELECTPGTRAALSEKGFIGRQSQLSLHLTGRLSYFYQISAQMC